MLGDLQIIEEAVRKELDSPYNFTGELLSTIVSRIRIIDYWREEDKLFATLLYSNKTNRVHTVLIMPLDKDGFESRPNRENPTVSALRASKDRRLNLIKWAIEHRGEIDSVVIPREFQRLALKVFYNLGINATEEALYPVLSGRYAEKYPDRIPHVRVQGNSMIIGLELGLGSDRLVSYKLAE